MKYKLTWLNHWSEKRKAADPRIIIRYAEEPDGWWEHEYIYYFLAADNDDAISKATQFVDLYSGIEDIEIYSLTDEKGNVIMTEEGVL